jgi:hypothetical protein
VDQKDHECRMSLRGSLVRRHSRRESRKSTADDVMQDTRLAGETLVDSLLRSVQGEPAQNKVLSTRLVIRRPCGG